MTPQDCFRWLDPADAIFVSACRDALKLERAAYAAADAERRVLLKSPSAAMDALRMALPILDDDLCSYQGDTPPRAYDKRGFVCLDDLSTDHDRWKTCETTLKALAAIRAVLPADEWAEKTYAETQAAVAHFANARAAGL